MFDCVLFGFFFSDSCEATGVAALHNMSSDSVTSDSLIVLHFLYMLLALKLQLVFNV